MLENGEMYINADRLNSNEKNAEELRSLWDSIDNVAFVDEYGQPWKETILEEMAFLIGSDAKEFLVHYAGYYKTTATKTYLFKWGCDGSVTPVIHIGTWHMSPYGETWKASAIEINHKYGFPRKVPKENQRFDAIPEIAELKKKYKNIGFSEIQWDSLPHLKVFYIYYGHTDELDQGESGLLVYDKQTKQTKIHITKNMFDEQC